jgi:UDP-N-acetylmuramate: L-alanyl-gamma-D-glutamyl-meso-diaminopimelate ligase
MTTAGHIHIAGICGTFMGGVAALAKAAGFRVTGCDLHVYPPMSEQLAGLEIDVTEGWDPSQLDEAPDCVVIGNAMSRGNPLVEAVLSRGLDYMSGPEWLARNVLQGRRVLAVAGTHGKTTTSSLLAYLLDAAGLDPGFLIGGVPANFGVSARLGGGDWFVVEADEYDTAFFDKRAKFVHYRPEIAILNNLEFDHADIYRDLAAIRWQFHQLLRTVPATGRLIVNAADANLRDVLADGCWTPVTRFHVEGGPPALEAAGWRFRVADTPDRIEVWNAGGWQPFSWSLTGLHNLQNTAAAVAAADAAGVPAGDCLERLAGFEGVRRRLETLFESAGISVYDDFAHHPTAIRMTIEGLRRRSPGGRIVIAFEPRSNTMKMGVHRDTLAPAFAAADKVFVLADGRLDWDVEGAFSPLGDKALVFSDAAAMRAGLHREAERASEVVFMSNGGFHGLPQQFVRDMRDRRRES